MVIKNVCFIIKISVSVSTSTYQAMYKIAVQYLVQSYVLWNNKRFKLIFKNKDILFI